MTERSEAMANKLKQLEDRVGVLENEFKELRALMNPQEQSPWWERVAGSLPNDDIEQQVIQEIRAIRAIDREAAGATDPDPFGTPVRTTKRPARKKV
jgi:hypothetical protein